MGYWQQAVRYSYRRESTGLALAVLRECQITVRKVMTKFLSIGILVRVTLSHLVKLLFACGFPRTRFSFY